jgi:hypothetical protein
MPMRHRSIYPFDMIRTRLFSILLEFRQLLCVHMGYSRNLEAMEMEKNKANRIVKIY